MSTTLKVKRTAVEINADINRMITKMDDMTNIVNNPKTLQHAKNIALSEYYEAKGAHDALKWVLGEPNY